MDGLICYFVEMAAVCEGIRSRGWRGKWKYANFGKVSCKYYSKLGGFTENESKFMQVSPVPTSEHFNNRSIIRHQTVKCTIFV